MKLSTAGVLAVGGALAVLCAAAVVVRTHVYFTVGFENAGSEIDNLGLAIQLATMVVGVVAIQLTARRTALVIVVVEGAVCLGANGWLGAVYAVGILAWYGILGARWLGRARLVLALAALVGMNACGFIGGRAAAGALVFSMIFTLRLVMYGYDRWQHDLERPPIADYLIYMLPAPLVIMPPYLMIIPMFSGFTAKIQPGLTRARVLRISKHLALALGFGGLRGVIELTSIDHNFYGHLPGAVLVAAAYAHAFMALLLLHGIDERLPLVRPLLATRFVTYWTRYQVHQKDAQVTLFFTPAVLALRRLNRYVAITLAVAWTMLAGNTVLHVVSRYCFLPSLWGRVRWVLITNVVMAAALAIEMCLDEYRARRRTAGLPAEPLLRGRVGAVIGWAVTMTLAAIAAT